MNIDEPGQEHIIDEDLFGEFHENLFQDLVADEILDPDIIHNNPNMEGCRQGAGICQNFLMRKLNQQTNILMHLMIIWEYNKLMLLIIWQSQKVV